MSDDVIKRHEPTSQELWNVGPYDILIHEWDDCGNHRLTIKCRARKPGFNTACSGWTCYDDVAVVELSGSYYGAVTDYYSGVFPSVFRMDTAKRVL